MPFKLNFINQAFVSLQIRTKNQSLPKTTFPIHVQGSFWYTVLEAQQNKVENSIYTATY